jgi:hypothetical protein
MNIVEIPTNIDTSTRSNHSCPHCGFEHDVISGDAIPNAGDLTICSRCSEVGIICPDLTVRIPTLAEQLSYDSDPELQAMRKMVKAAWGAITL